MQIKLFKKEKSFKKATESLWSHINLFWKLAVCFVLVATIFAFAFGYYFFKQINKEINKEPVFKTAGAISQVETIKKEKISEILEYFSLRQKKSNQILNSPASFADPSL